VIPCPWYSTKKLLVLREVQQGADREVVFSYEYHTGYEPGCAAASSDTRYDRQRLISMSTNRRGRSRLAITIVPCTRRLLGMKLVEGLKQPWSRVVDTVVASVVRA
jgi:hypothetical protein